MVLKVLEPSKFDYLFCNLLAFFSSNLRLDYHISSPIRQSCFLPKQSQKSRSVLKDGPRTLELFGKDKTCIIAKFHRPDLVISRIIVK